MSSRPHRPSQQHYDSSSSSSSYPASDSDISSPSSSDSYRHSIDSYHLPVASIEVLRCMRCARTVEATSTDSTASSGMVRVGHNIYYCHRCAKLVGYK